jgi:hypothetical protein
MRQPDAKDKLREAFGAAKVPTEIEVYKSLHGWCARHAAANGASDLQHGGGNAGQLVALYWQGPHNRCRPKAICAESGRRVNRRPLYV